MSNTYTIAHNKPVPATPWAVCRQPHDGFAATIAWFYRLRDAREYALWQNTRARQLGIVRKGKK